MGYPDIPRTQGGDPYPIIWDDKQKKWVAWEGQVQLSGSLLERYGATEAQRPAANSVPIGTVYMAVQTQQMWQSDGSQWVVM